jgi:hypothetical protein
MLNKYAFHPFIFALYPVFHLYVTNSQLWPIEEMILPAIMLGALTAMVWALTSVLLKNGRKAAIVV